MEFIGTGNLNSEKIIITSHNGIDWEIKEQYDPTHFVLTNLKLEKVYEPWPSINRPNKRYDGVFLNIGGIRHGN